MRNVNGAYVEVVIDRCPRFGNSAYQGSYYACGGEQAVLGWWEKVQLSDCG